MLWIRGDIHPIAWNHLLPVRTSALQDWAIILRAGGKRSRRGWIGIRAEQLEGAQVVIQAAPCVSTIRCCPRSAVITHIPFVHACAIAAPARERDRMLVSVNVVFD